MGRSRVRYAADDLVDELPMEPHDVPLHGLATEDGLSLRTGP